MKNNNAKIFSWNKIDNYCKKIIEKIKKDKFKPEILITVQRGGFVPSVILSHLLEVREVVVVNIQRTQSDDRFSKKIKPRVIFSGNIDIIKNKRVLIIDDIVGSGLTIITLFNALYAHCPKEVKIASIFLHISNYRIAGLKPHIDYIGHKTHANWVVFPWEKK